MNNQPEYIVEISGSPGNWYAVAKSITNGLVLDSNNSGSGCETAKDAASAALWHLVPEEEA